MDNPLDRLNALTDAQARAELLRCCGARRWAEQMTARRPFASEDDLLAAADAVWWRLDRTDWLEALAAHPRIGDFDVLRAKFASTAAWAAGEQAGVARAGDETLRGLADGNRGYEARFGFLFIVCATGKSADEMLGLLRARLANDVETELAVSAGEQAKITQIRLRKLCT
jgi:2-oxo-4-hydroxy-4-carboxy-5-ureidoimidazoline decarboxylase